MQAKIDKLNSMKSNQDKLNAQELNEQNRQEIKIHLLEIREKNANNRYQNLLIQMNEMDDQVTRYKRELNVYNSIRNKSNELLI